MQRRTFVYLCLPCVGLLSGCSSPISFGDGAETDLYVENRRDTEVTVDIRVTRSTRDETLVDETVTLAAYAEGDYSARYPDFGDTGKAVAHLDVRDGPEGTFEFGVPSDSESFGIQIRRGSFETLEGNA